MGVRGLFRLLHSICRPAKLTPQHGLHIGIDAFCILYLFKTRTKDLEDYLDLLLALKYKLTMIMDKKAQKEKAAVVEQRKELRAERRAEAKELEEAIASEAFTELDERCQEILTTTLLHKQNSAWQLTPEHTKWFHTLLESKGISLILAKDEADAELAHGGFDCVISSDSDLIVLGCSCLLVPKSGKHGIQHEVYRYADVKKALGFDGEQLYELAFLAGCDVQPKTIVDIETAASWLRFYGSLERIAAKKEDITTEHLAQYKHLRENVWS